MLTIDDIKLKYLISFKVIRAYFMYLILITGGITSVLFVVTISLFDANAGFYRAQLDQTAKHSKTIEHDPSDITLLCNVIGCDEAFTIDNGKIFQYERKDSKFIVGTEESKLPDTWYRSITKDYDTVVEYGKFIFVVENKGPIALVKRLFFTFSALGFFFYTGLFINLTLKRFKEEQLDRNNVTNYIEHKLQRNIAEVLHHEMGAPVAIIRSEVEAIHRVIYNGSSKYRRACDKEVDNRIKHIEIGLTRLDDILTVMKTAKQLKNSKSCVPIMQIIDSVVNSTKCFKINNLKMCYKNQDILNTYSARVSVGLFSNIIQVMINNAMEAKATTLTFSALEVNYNHIDLYVTDDGSGIRDSLGNIIKDPNQIFKYGYSTKNKQGEVIITESKIVKLLNFIGISVNPTSAIRGIGLAVTKQILNRSGGDITVSKTSEYGTTFKIRLHVKKIPNKEIKK